MSQLTPCELNQARLINTFIAAPGREQHHYDKKSGTVSTTYVIKDGPLKGMTLRLPLAFGPKVYIAQHRIFTKVMHAHPRRIVATRKVIKAVRPCNINPDHFKFL